MKKRLIAMLACLCLIACSFSLSATAAAEEGLDVSSLYKEKDTDDTWDEAEAEFIDLAALDGTELVITQKGDYVLSGTWVGQVVIQTGVEDKVRLILNGVQITSPEGPAIYEKQGDKLIITLAEGTENILTDGAAITEGDDTIGAALYAEDDLSINGTGRLLAHGTVKHGIQSKADLIIAGGEITVDSVNDGIRGRNSVLVLDGSISVTAGGDGIVSTREDKEGKGWLVIAGGKTEIRTGEGAGEVRASANSHGFNRGGWDWNNTVSSSDTEASQKGIKAATDLTVLGGEITLDCADDGLHAANVTVSDGTVNIRTGDDGIHGDTETVINGGVIAIAQCYEGIEGTNVTINGGEIQIIASDDGINASGGSDGSGWGGRGNDRFAGSDGTLTINGGHVEVTASGDGLDSNGSISITGGVTGVWAATSMGEGAIDFNGTGSISGGLVMITSVNGTMTDTSRISGASLVSIPLNGAGASGQTIIIQDGSGQTLGTFTPMQSYDSLLIAGESIQENAQIRVTAGGSSLFEGGVTASMMGTQSLGTNGFGNWNGNGHGNGGQRRGR
ncbi:MAG: carbohydrate-binding domain-containing protein [Clostridia bacterium]|nr:carbohydrate-binding domain-containing protein [Clostridia bacterium]